jgi:hypothetical protein
MNRLFASLALSSMLLVGCAGNEDDVDSSASNQTGCVSPAAATATFNKTVGDALYRVEQDYAAALAAHTAAGAAASTAFDTAARQAHSELTAALDQLGWSSPAQAEAHRLIDEYNAKVGPNGPLAEKHKAAVYAAKTTYDAEVAAAKKRYEAAAAEATKTFKATVCGGG